MLNNNKKAQVILLFFLSIFFLSASFAATIIPETKLSATQKFSGSKQPNLATTHLTQADIKKSPVANLGELFQQRQSVVRLTDNTGDGTSSALSIRGFGENAAQNSLILVDGFPLVNPTLIAPNFNSIPLTDIARVDIFQGSEGTLWGNQAVGGVVNIITKHPQHFFVNSIASVGSFSSNYYHLLIGDKATNGAYFKAFGIISSTQNYRDHNQQSGNNLSATIGKDYATGMLSFNAQSYAAQTNLPGGLNIAQFIDDPTQATNFKNNGYYRTTQFALFNAQNLTARWLLETRLLHRYTNGSGHVNVDFNRNEALTIFNPRVIGTINKSKFIAGYYAERSNYQLVNSKVQPSANSQEQDVYVQLQTPIYKNIQLTLGSRYATQHNDVHAIPTQSAYSKNQAWVNEVGITYQLTNTLAFFLRRDGNFSFPKANEQTWIRENTRALQAQIGTSYEFGTTWRTQLQQLQINMFQLDLQNEIAFDPTQSAQSPFGAYTNYDRTKRFGISLNEQYFITTKATLNTQLNYVKAHFSSGKFNSNVIPSVPALNANVNLKYDWNEHWSTVYALLYTSSRYAANDTDNRGKKLTSYWLQDLAVQYLYKYFMISAEVRNLFNVHYASYATYNTFRNNIVYYPAVGRNFLLTFKCNFD